MQLLNKIEKLPLPIVALIAACGLAFTGLLVFKDPFPKFLSGPQDFAGFYMGAKNIGTPQLYDPLITARQEAVLTGVGKLPTTFQYIRLPFYAALLRPITLLSYSNALLLWKVISLCGLICASCFIDSSRKVGVLAISWSVGAMVMLKWGQDTWITLLLLCAFLRLLAREKTVLSGCCIGFAIALKPHIFLPFVAVAIVAGRSFLRSVITVIGAVLGLSFLVQGGSWPVGWLGTLLVDSQTSNPSLMPTIEGIFGRRPLGHAFPLYVAVVLGMIWLAVWAARRLPLDLATAVAVLLGLLGSVHSYAYDLLLAIPASLLITRRTGAKKALALLTPLSQLYFVPVIGSLAAVVAGFCAVLAPLRVRWAQTDIPSPPPTRKSGAIGIFT